jgi:hypothetical protein
MDIDVDFKEIENQFAAKVIEKKGNVRVNFTPYVKSGKY